MFRKFNKKKYKEQLPDGDERKRFIDYPTEGMLAEIYHFVSNIFSDTCYLKASEEMNNSQESKYSEKIKRLQKDLNECNIQLNRTERDYNKLVNDLESSLKINEFLVECLKEKYENGLFVASNGFVNNNTMPVVCIKNGEEIAKDASEVTISWSTNDFPHIEIAHDDKDYLLEN